MSVNQKDQDFDVSLAVAAPEVDSDEFIVQITAPNTFGWAGLVLGDSFDDNMMLAAWPNGNTSVASCRMTKYALSFRTGYDLFS